MLIPDISVAVMHARTNEEIHVNTFVQESFIASRQESVAHAKQVNNGKTPY